MNIFDKLARLININSYSHNKKGVDEVGHLLKDYLSPLKFTFEEFKQEKYGNQYYFTSPTTEGAKILLMGHMDTVFPPNTFEGFKEDDTYVYGPGVMDMKGGILVAVEALLRLKEQVSSIKNVDVLFTPDEEIGSEATLPILQRIAPKYDYCLNFEAAGNEYELVSGRKGIGIYHLIINGIAGHAGNQEQMRVDANLEAAHKILQIYGYAHPERGTSVNVGEVNGGQSMNIISPRADLHFEFRFQSDKERQRILEEFTTLTHPISHPKLKIALEGKIRHQVMSPSPAQNAFLQRISSICHDDITTEFRGGVSDANIITSLGVTTLDGFGPIGQDDHSPRERALKESFEQRINMVTKILINHQNSYWQ